jgi:type IV pilus assembly protein PilO
MGLIPSDPAQQKKMMIALLPLVLVGAYYFLLHGSSTEELERKQRRLEQIEGRNRNAQQLAAQIGPELESRLAIYEQHMLRLEELIPHAEEVPQLIATMATRAEETGVEIAQLNPGRVEQSEHYNRQTFEIGVLGEYHDLGEFLASIGSLPRIITATNLRVGPAPGTRTVEGDALRLRADFRIQTYVLPPPDSAAAATTRS